MLPDTIIDDLFGGFIRYLSKRKVLILLGSLVLFSPDSGQLVTEEVWKSNANEFKNLAVDFFGTIKLYQYIVLVAIIFFVSPSCSNWFFKKLFMFVVGLSWKSFMTRKDIVVNKMEGDCLSDGEMKAFQDSCRLAMGKINRLSILYADCNSVVSITFFYLAIVYISLVVYLAPVFVIVFLVLGVFLAKKAALLYLNEIWPLCVILEEVEHHKKIMSLKEVVQDE